MAVLGLSVIALSIGASFGMGFYLGIFFADIQPIIPFLLLGLGVDNIFVIAQSLEKLPEEVRKVPDVSRRIALAMKHAGVSITVTSATDICAFLIGATTVRKM